MTARPDLVAVKLSDGTLRTERADLSAGQLITVDTMLRDPFRIDRQMRQMADVLGISDMLFPRPIMDRVRDRADDLRAGRSRRRYRGMHRSKRHSRRVDDLLGAVPA